MNRTLHSIILIYLSTLSLFSQPFYKRGSNALLPQNCYIKYLYNFPYNSSTIYYSDKLPDLEVRKYKNSELIEPLFNKIFIENYQVYNPNFWESVEDLHHAGPSGVIDTNGIMLYLHAGWDTAISINENNQITRVPFYTPPDTGEISGLFFFESWYLSSDNGSFEKNVIAYLPVREYWDEYALESGQAVRQKRLVFMVYNPDDKKESGAGSRRRLKGFIPLYSGIEHELMLYNRPYHEYIYRDNTKTDISEEEYHEWGYHTFDFYKQFDAGRFLKELTGMALEGKINAVDPCDPEKNLAGEEIIRRIGEGSYRYHDQNSQRSMKHETQIRYDNLNSIVFNEDWYFDPATLKIYKKVNSMTIIKHEIQYDDYTGDFLRLKKTPVIAIVY